MAEKEWAVGDKISDFINGLIDDYKFGRINGRGFCEAWKEYTETHRLSYSRDEKLRRAVEEILPETCEAYMAAETAEDGEADSGLEAQKKKRELEFWKGLKDCKHLLYYGWTFFEEYERYLKTGNCRYDPVEFTDEFLAVEPEVERLVREETGEGGWTGFCHTYWAVRKRILKERFGIEWKSIDDRFPGLLID